MRLALALAALFAACAPESVESVVLSPTSAEIETLLLEADARWEATGAHPDRVVIADVGGAGAPVQLAAEECEVSVTRVRKQGHAWRGVLWMDLCRPSVDVVMHEMGHAMRIEWHVDDYPETEHECDGAMRPVMCAHVGHSITELDLSAACEVGDCSSFTPER